ncbi:Putative MADS-box transcription factor family protein [Zea mays]|uniref:Putative MADS-box transcription factor family protein n=1 Tax=Zea mays TaxID=4577 RepID=A0A1D6LVK6_MAIZE|nr:Putative MADS-box transcription factor family protein [Zea mays]AQK83299.1 Putative MADS-box transcription factor family protein [Zea mays]
MWLSYHSLLGASTTSFSKFQSLNYHLESYLHKNTFFIFSISNNFSISYLQSKESFKFSIFD